MKYFISVFIVILAINVQAQKKQSLPTQPATPAFDFEKQFATMKYRNIGPTRGGRSTAVAGIASQPNTFFTGTTGGGVWKTDDGGNTWNNITDGQIMVGSIGSIRVAPSDANVIYVGTGSADPRGNVSIGKGIYKSSDAGKTWALMGLEKGGQIGRIEVHPQNPDVVYAAVLGNPFAYNPDRGVYRSKDGGKTWERVLFVNDKTGAMDLVMDPNNPRILFAGMWQVQRKPWTLIDGGADGGVYQSKDGGDTWKKLEGGLPTGVLGKIGIAVSPANSDRVWVLVETPDDAKGGMFRSDDGAKTFTRINGDRELRTRHWYYTHVFADPKDQETVYVNNVSFLKSIDGGKSFSSIRVPHGDCHDLWINPNQTSTMIHSNDGGAQITYNGGKTWSTPYNIPTSEFYRVEVDNDYPYRVYGCQQDNSSMSVPSNGRWGRGSTDWLTWGGEAGHVAVDPKTGVIYSGEYSGILYRFDPKTGHNRMVQDYPQLHDGLPLHKVKYRFQWNAPITISPHNSNVLYHCSQYVHKTTDGGQTWQVVSPDLTLNKKEYQELPGGPVQIDYTGVENYNTIFVLEESPVTPNELWAGSDDGLVHISIDGGKSWSNITPKGIPTLATVNSIDISRHKKGKAYVTVHNYRLGDFKPYVFKTEDFGKTWVSITTGIPADWFTRVVREDPNKEGLLYCGTEFGMFASVDDGKSWNTFQLNLPRVPVTDLLIKNNDLVISTQGRAFWILDDLSAMEQFIPAVADNNFTLFTPRTAYRAQVSGTGAEFNFYLKEKLDSAKTFWLEVLDGQGKVLRTWSTEPGKKSRESKIDAKQGLNRFVWDLQLSAPKIASGTVFGYGPPDGVPVPPGLYTVRATIGKLGEKSYETNFTVTKDPRWNVTNDDLNAQYDLALKAAEEMNHVHLTIRKIRSIRTQTTDMLEHAGEGKKSALTPLSKSLDEKLTTLENLLTQTKSKAGQDPINYPPMFDEQWNWFLQLLNGQDARPNSGAYALYADLKKQNDQYMAQFEAIMNNQLKTFNQMLVELKVTGVQLEAVDK